MTGLAPCTTTKTLMIAEIGKKWAAERATRGESKLNFLQGISPGKTLVARRRGEK